jgi:hypothetical protein
MFITDWIIASTFPRRCGLVDHEGDVFRAAERDLAHDPEQLERVDRTDDQVVVRVLAVEMEAAEQPVREQQRDDLLDVVPCGWPVSST